MPALLEQPKLSDQQIAELVDEGGKLHKELVPLKKKLERLEAIKAILRDTAGKREIKFLGAHYIASIEQKPDTIARVVPEADVPRVAKLAGDVLTDLCTFHPSKGHAKSFELNALKLLPKKAAQTLIDLLTVPATPWVRFS
jgi:hypothetical protein